MSQVTKRALEQSLKNLLLKKPLTKITINDIAEDCGINRMTFYYHLSTTLWNGRARRTPARHLRKRKPMTLVSRVSFRGMRQGW